jgi:hypothetical protein
MVNGTWSVPGNVYRYIQHDLTSVAYLPNAFFTSKGQLLASDYARNVTKSDEGQTTWGGSNHVYDPVDCPYPSSDCWPGGSKKSDPPEAPTPTPPPQMPTPTPGPPPPTGCNDQGGEGCSNPCAPCTCPETYQKVGSKWKCK